MVQHIACVMDGNRRWAVQQGMQALLGHRQGIEAVKRIIKFCLDRGVPYLSLYTFSLENFKRSEQEKSYLFGLLAEAFSSDKNINEFIEHGVRVRFIGDRSLFPQSLVDVCSAVEQKTAHVTRLTVNFLLCYGARQEIVHAAQEIARAIASEVLAPEEVTATTFEKHLWTYGIPDPDIVIRPGNVIRLSNFLLYQSAYSEYFFLECLWPDITVEHLEKIMIEFGTRQRRFGGS